MPNNPISSYADNWNALDESVFQVSEELLTQFSYKPSWRFDLERAPQWGGLKLRTSFLAPDSRANKPPFRKAEWFERCTMCHQSLNDVEIPITGTYFINIRIAEDVLHGNERLFWRAVRHSIENAEHHEIDEWFRVRGELVNDPHKDT